MEDIRRNARTGRLHPARETSEVVRHARTGIGVDDRCRQPLVFAEFGQYLGRQRDKGVGHQPAQDLRGAALMDVVAVGVQKADRDRFNAVLLERGSCTRDRILIERHEHVAVGIESLGDFDPAMPRHQRRRTLDRVVVEVGPRLPADLDNIAKTGGGQQRGRGAAPLDDQIGHDRRAVAEERDRLPRCAGLLEQCGDPIGNRNRRIERCRRQLEMPRRAALIIGSDQIGEGTADIDTDADHRSNTNRLRVGRRPGAICRRARALP